MWFFVYSQGCIKKYKYIYIIYIYKYIYIHNNNMVGMRVYRYDNNNHLCRRKIKEIVQTLYT